MSINIFMKKAVLYFYNRIQFLNITNSNVRNLAVREIWYHKLKKKYRHLLKSETLRLNKKQFSNKVWICWFQGMDQAPKLVKKCYETVCQYLNDKDIIVITENNFSDYVIIPQYIIKKWRKGTISYAHFSDILRLELLIKYGGLWIDSTVFLTGRPFFIDEKKLDFFVYKSISLYKKEKLCVNASNWLIYSPIAHIPLLLLLRILLYQYWKQHNIALNYNIYHMFFTMATEIYCEELEKVPTYSNIPPHVLQFELLTNYNQERFEEIKKMSDVHKLDRRVMNNSKGTFYDELFQSGGEKK